MKKSLLLLLLLAPFAHAQQIEGAWIGAASSAALWGGIRLNVSHAANGWVATGRLEFEGRPGDVQETALDVDGSHVTFHANWSGHPFAFNGTVQADRLSGAFTTDISGAAVTGDWSLTRLKPEVSDKVELPVATGPYAVGRKTFYWLDERRNEELKRETNKKRELLVYLWYPAQRVQQNAAYLPDLAALGNELPSGAAAAMRSLTVNAGENAAILKSSSPFPVVIFSAGAGEKTLFYSSLEMELASQGYVVAAVEHTYDVTTLFPDGRVAHALPEKNASSSAEEERQAIEDKADYRARDMLFVKRKLAELATRDGDALFMRLDHKRVAAVGHSLGGMAAMRACQLDPSIGACVNIDGSYRARPFPSNVSLNLRQPTMWLRRPLYVFTDVQLKRFGMTREDFDREVSLGQQLMRGGMDVQLPHPDIDHMDFSDIRLLEAGISPQERAARLLTMQMARDWVTNFVQKSLDGQPLRSSLIDTKSNYREAHISLLD